MYYTTLKYITEQREICCKGYVDYPKCKRTYICIILHITKVKTVMKPSMFNVLHVTYNFDIRSVIAYFYHFGDLYSHFVMKISKDTRLGPLTSNTLGIFTAGHNRAPM